MNPANLLITLIDKQYPVPAPMYSLHSLPVPRLLSEIRWVLRPFSFQAEEKPSTKAVEAFETVYKLINNCSVNDLTEDEKMIFAEFFIIFCDYLEFINSDIKNEILFLIFTDELTEEIKNNGAPLQVISKMTEFFSEKDLSYLANFYLKKLADLKEKNVDIQYNNLQIQYDDSALFLAPAEEIYDEHTCAALVILKDYLNDKQHIELINILIYFLQSTQRGAKSITHLAKLVPKMNNLQLKEIVDYIFKQSFKDDTFGTDDLFSFLSALKHFRGDNGKIGILDSEIFITIFQRYLVEDGQNKQRLLDILVELKDNYSVDDKNTLVKMLIARDGFRALEKMYDSLTPAQREAVTTLHIKWATGQFTFYVDVNQVAIRTFKDDFNKELLIKAINIALVMLAETSHVSNTSAAVRLWMLLEFIPETPRDVIINQLINMQGTRLLGNVLLSSFKYVAKKDRPAVIDKIYSIIKQPDGWNNSFATNLFELNIRPPADFFSSDYIDKLLFEIDSNNDYNRHHDLFLKLVMIIPESYVDIVIKKFCEKLQKFMEDTYAEPNWLENVLHKFISLTYLKKITSPDSQDLIQKTISFFLENDKSPYVLPELDIFVKISNVINTPLFRSEIIKTLNAAIKRYKQIEIAQNVRVTRVTIILGAIKNIIVDELDEEVLKDILLALKDNTVAKHAYDILIKLYFASSLPETRKIILEALLEAIANNPEVLDKFNLNLDAIIAKQEKDERDTVRLFLVTKINSTLEKPGKDIYFTILTVYVSRLANDKRLEEVATLPDYDPILKKLAFLSIYDLSKKESALSELNIIPRVIEPTIVSYMRMVQ